MKEKKGPTSSLPPRSLTLLRMGGLFLMAGIVLFCIGGGSMRSSISSSQHKEEELMPSMLTVMASSSDSTSGKSMN